MAIQYIQLGKLNQNTDIKLFNRTLREKLVDGSLFVRINDVRKAVYWWQFEYDELHPHHAWGGIPNAVYRIKITENSTYELSA